MPEQLYPPFAGDTGAEIQPRMLNRWMDVSPQNGALQRPQTFIVIPMFTVSSTWKGYSEIVVAFPFTSPNNLTLKPFTTPLTTDYLVCVEWTDGNNNVYRYKLWEDINEVMSQLFVLYTGQIIKKNFRLEIWSVGEAVPVPLVLSIPVNIIAGEDTGLIAGEG